VPARRVPALRLRSGALIEDPLAQALRLVGAYDLAPVPEDSVLTEADVRVANAAAARMSASIVDAILAKAPEIGGLLARVPPSVALTDPEDRIPWAELERLFRTLLEVPAVRLARATKILHKKRPKLIPMLDSVVVRYLEQVDGAPAGEDEAERAVGLTRSFKRELDAAADVVAPLQAELRRRGTELTDCRLVDALVWAAAAAG
jgi:hypothetical protein